MKITFIVPAFNLSGGLRVVSIYANYLASKGHDITVISPSQTKITIKKFLKNILSLSGYNLKSNYSTDFFHDDNVNLQVVDSSRVISESDVPNSDIIIATFWNTAEWVNTFPPNKGKKIYFVQHHEIHPWLPVERVKETLRLPIQKIVVARWLKDVLIDQYGNLETSVSVINNAVDHEQFIAPVREKNRNITFGFMYSQRAFKGSQLAIDALNSVCKQYKNIRVICFGQEPHKEVNSSIPRYFNYIERPKQSELAEIYSSCDAWLFTSSNEGFGLPILEAMACRTPVIGTRCGAAPDLLSTGGGILIDVNDFDALIEGLKEIINLSSEEWKKISNKAYHESLKHDWNNACSLFEKTIIEQLKEER